MVAKRYQNPKGGLNAKGRKKFGVKAPVSKGTNPRRVSFAARFSKVRGPLKQKKGRPTRLKLALKKCGVKKNDTIMLHGDAGVAAQLKIKGRNKFGRLY